MTSSRPGAGRAVPGWLGAASLPANVPASLPAGLPAGYGWLAPPGTNPQTAGAAGTRRDDATPCWVTAYPHETGHAATQTGPAPRARGGAPAGTRTVPGRSGAPHRPPQPPSGARASLQTRLEAERDRIAAR